MLEIKGRYNTAKVFTDTMDEESVAQIIQLCCQSFTEGEKIRLMPDVHAGKGCTIGTTMTVSDKTVPNLVGVDIGCGMETLILREDHLDFNRLDKIIRAEIPSGTNVRRHKHRFGSDVRIRKLKCADGVRLDRAFLSIGSLGGGNHFIEVDRDDDGRLYLIFHSGSRGLGVEVATFYQKAAIRALKGRLADRFRIIEEYRACGKAKEIQSFLEKWKEENDIPLQLAYVQGDLFEDYLHDMRIVQHFAEVNRNAMADVLVKELKLHIEDRFTTIHNYIDTESMILRKGAVSARKGEKLLIPVNMRDGSLLCTGKGNEEWNFSAPHGAGRLMSRSAAKARFKVSDFKKEMEGVFTTSVGSGTLDECPMAYKPVENLLSNITPTVSIDAVIRPVYNFKASY